LNIPQITYAQTASAEKDKITADRNMGDKAVTTEATYPVLVTVTKEINEPRLPSLMQILAAANKPINEWTADSLSSGLKPLVETVELKGVPMERKNIIYQDDLDESISKLVDNLAKEGVLGG
jgi:electron transfer flavoprotein beta subunit